MGDPQNTSELFTSISGGTREFLGVNGDAVQASLFTDKSEFYVCISIGTKTVVLTRPMAKNLSKTILRIIEAATKLQEQAGVSPAPDDLFSDLKLGQ